MRHKLPPLNALRSFEAAARHGSFRDAADELCVSHSAISHQIKLLENFLGTELFHRRARAVELTDVGRDYYPIVQLAFFEISEATTKILAPEESPTLTLSLYSTLAIRWLIPRLSSFQDAHADINVQLQTAQWDVDFSTSNVDACIMIGDAKDDTLESWPLFACELFPVASPQFIAQYGPFTSPSQLANVPLIQVYPSQQDWEAWLGVNGVEDADVDGGLQFDSYDHALTIAAQGHGVGLGMYPYVAHQLESGDLVKLFEGYEVTQPAGWRFVCRRERRHEPKMRAFYNWLRQQLAHTPGITLLSDELFSTDPA